MKLPGYPASMGVAVGSVCLWRKNLRRPTRLSLRPASVQAELERLNDAIDECKNAFIDTREQMFHDYGDSCAAIMDAHLLMLDDPMLKSAALRTISEQKTSAQWAVRDVVDGLKASMLANEAPYLRERAADVEHVGRRIIEQLDGEIETPPLPKPGQLVFAIDLSPAEAVLVLTKDVVGLALQEGGVSGHTAILARALGVPSVVGVQDLFAHLHDDAGVNAIVDGLAGSVTLAPTSAEIQVAVERQRRFQAFASTLREDKGLAVQTLDGVEVSVQANIELRSEANRAVELGADGVGLCRTEFLFAGEADATTEEVQWRVYKEVAESLAPRSVVFRTTDIRADKSSLVPNSVGGSLRRAVDAVEPLRTQLRALLRSSVNANVSIMFPMVSDAEEFAHARTLLDRCAGELRAEGIAVPNVPVGAMIEVPSAVEQAQNLARECDFFSVGTNDLTQYALGIDRCAPPKAAAEASLHPNVLRLLRKTADVATLNRVPLSLCGDMAVHPLGMILALGLGFRSLSVPIALLPLARESIRRLSVDSAKAAALASLGCADAQEVSALLFERFGEGQGDLWSERGVHP